MIREDLNRSILPTLWSHKYVTLKPFKVETILMVRYIYNSCWTFSLCGFYIKCACLVIWVFATDKYSLQLIRGSQLSVKGALLINQLKLSLIILQKVPDLFHTYFHLLVNYQLSEHIKYCKFESEAVTLKCINFP